MYLIVLAKKPKVECCSLYLMRLTLSRRHRETKVLFRATCAVPADTVKNAAVPAETVKKSLNVKSILYF